MVEKIIKSNLSKEELNERFCEVFNSQEGDEVFSIEAMFNNDKLVEVFINMGEIDDGQFYIFDYKPDMTDRPEALAYLLGLREDFND